MKRVSSRKLIVGIDLHMDHPQICVYDRGSQESLALTMKIGNAAVNLSELFSGEEATDLKSQARTITGIFREVFRTYGVTDPGREISGICVAVPALSREMVDLLRAVFDELSIAPSKAYVQDYKESFFNYMAYQKPELWNRNTALFLFEEDSVQFMRLRFNQMTRPRTVRVASEEPHALSEDSATRDLQFGEIIESSLRHEMYSSIFITGSGFSEKWAEQSKKLLTKSGRKAFFEDCIFARGACNAARERVDEKRIHGVRFLGDALVQYDIGMEMQVGEKVVYYPLITAGSHWYNVSCDCEFLLGDKPQLTFIISSMESGGRHQSRMALPGLPERPERTTRLHLHMSFSAADHCDVEVTDLGFGEIFPSSGQSWHEVIASEIL